VNGGMQALASAKVGDLSPRPHARVRVEDAMWKVVAEMTSKGRGAVLVEDAGALVGIFTERDLLNRVDYGDALWSHLVVGDVMTPHPMVIHPDDSLSEALRRLTVGHRRHLPVVDGRGHVLGLISVRDILSYIAERFPDDMLNLPPHPDHES
jgi:CBS domain-containing protein